jgi:hypothetical protein
MDLAKKIETYKALIRQIDLLEEEKKRIAQEILALMPDPKFETPQYKAVRYQRLSIKTTLEHARLFDATKMVEELDKEKIKEIFLSGVPIEGVEEQTFLRVSEKNSPTE